MTAAIAETNRNKHALEAHGGPAPTRIVVAYGFWIFILSDIVMFSALFAAYAVLSGNTAGGPTGAELFNLRNAFILTMSLLLSSYTCGLLMLSAEQGRLERPRGFGVRRLPWRRSAFTLSSFCISAAGRMIRTIFWPSRLAC